MPHRDWGDHPKELLGLHILFLSPKCCSKHAIRQDMLWLAQGKQSPWWPNSTGLGLFLCARGRWEKGREGSCLGGGRVRSILNPVPRAAQTCAWYFAGSSLSSCINCLPLALAPCPMVSSYCQHIEYIVYWGNKVTSSKLPLQVGQIMILVINRNSFWCSIFLS